MSHADSSLAQGGMDTLVERICAVLQCERSELRANLTPEGLIELRVARTFAERGPARTTVVGTIEQLQAWVERLVADLGPEADSPRA